jgi:aspartokinase
MVTISHLTKKLLQERPFIHEALEKDLINVMALAEEIRPDIENEIGQVKLSAISMAIRRYVEEHNKQPYRRVKLTKKTDIVVKSNLFEISLKKSVTIFKKLIKLYDVVDFEIGDTLNVIHGNYEILVVSNERYEKKFLEILKGEYVKTVNKNMASISLKIPQEMIDAPGYYYAITKTLNVNNISIIDVVNTETEATFILYDKDVSKAYNVLKREITVEYYKK